MSTNTRIVSIVSVFFILSAVSSCGGGSSSSSSGSADVSDISELPSATSPVSDSSSSSLSQWATKYLATSGYSLRETDASDFDENSSVAGCEMFNMTKHAIQGAATGDLIQCYVSVVAPEIFSGIDIYDGAYHIFTLDDETTDSSIEDSGENAGPDKVKFKISKDGNGMVTEFEMFACKDDSQEMYLRQSISGSDFSMTTKFIGSGGPAGDDGSFADSIAVSGTLANGEFVDEKEISMNFTNTSSYFDFFGVIDAVQTSSTMAVTGYMEGSSSFSDPSSSFDCTFSNSIVSKAQLLDSNTDSSDFDVGLYALGDGATSYEASGGCTQSGAGSSGEQTWTDTIVESWNGDTFAVVDSNDFTSTVASATHTDQSSPTIAYDTSESWDCSGTAETDIGFDELQVDPMGECSNFDLSHQHIECWQIVEEGVSQEVESDDTETSTSTSTSTSSGSSTGSSTGTSTGSSTGSGSGSGSGSGTATGTAH